MYDFAVFVLMVMRASAAAVASACPVINNPGLITSSAVAVATPGAAPPTNDILPNSNNVVSGWQDGTCETNLDVGIVKQSPIQTCYNYAGGASTIKILWPRYTPLTWVTIFAQPDCSAVGNVTLARLDNLWAEAGQCLEVATGHAPGNWTGEVNVQGRVGSVLLGTGAKPKNIPPNYSARQ